MKLTRDAETMHGAYTPAELRTFLTQLADMGVDEHTPLRATVSFGGWLRMLTVDPAAASKLADKTAARAKRRIPDKPTE